jgi:hypothetical protein
VSESRTFTFYHFRWVYSVEFFRDRIEYVHNERGPEFEKTKKIIPRADLSPRLTEVATNPVIYLWRRFGFAGGCLALAVASFVFLPVPGRYSSGLFLLLSLIAIYRGIRDVEKTHWIKIVTKDGNAAFNLQVSKWTNDEREEFLRFYHNWIVRPEGVKGLAAEAPN